MIGRERASPRLRLPRQHVKFLSETSFHSLWQHYISMTSRPLANSDKGVMRIAGIAELMRLPPIVPVLTRSLRHSLFAVVTPRPLKGARSIFFSSPSSSPLLKLSQPSLFFSFFFLLFSSPRCQLLVPHLVILEHHSLNHSLKILSHSPSLCHNTLSE